MKRHTTMCLLAMIFTLNTAAQYVNGTAATKASRDSFKEEYTDWDEIRMSIGEDTYHQSDVQIGDWIIDDIHTIFSVHVSYRHGFILSQETPFFLETGIGLKWGNYDEGYDNWVIHHTGVEREILNIWTLEAPINIGYQIHKTGSNWRFYPYTGIYLRMHITGRLEVHDPHGNQFSANIFDEDEVDPTFKRIQCGWQLGGDIQYRKFAFGWSYGIDFNRILPNTRVSTISFNAGYRF